MSDKDINDIDIKGTIINTLILDGNKYIPYVPFIKAIFGVGYLNQIKLLNPIIKDYIYTFDNKKYVTLMALMGILKRCNDEDLKVNICSQVVGLRLKNKDYIEKVEVGIEALVHLSNKCTGLFNKIHDYDLKQCDLLHELENSKDIKKIALDLKKLRLERRKAKMNIGF